MSLPPRQPQSAEPASAGLPNSGGESLPARAEGEASLRVVPLHTHHERTFAENRFVYPVLSRRSHGISLGVNLNPDKVCNFDCIYCQVDRTRQSETRFVDMQALVDELDSMLSFVRSGQIFKTSEFQETPTALRRLNDIAFSGDGEPTTYRNFDEIIATCADIKAQHHANDAKMVLISNASMFHRPHVQRGLEYLDRNNGEIWAKLEAGTEEYYKLVERTPIPFRQVLDNITDAARRRPIVIQALFMRIHGKPPSEQELAAFADRLNEIRAAGGQFKLIQVYTVARQPAESFVEAISDCAVDEIVEMVQVRCGIPAQAFYGVGSDDLSGDV
ncbi:MAG: radical SAM protein [Pirellulales bacterium]|nr:radical SAM protein [Pirellulales bacterium]